jgi:hypothetical protein
MEIRRFILTLFVCALVGLTLPCAGQDQPSAPPPTQGTSDTAAKDAPAKAAEKNNPRADTESATAQPKLDLTPDANGILSEVQMRELIRIVVENYRDNTKKQHNYTYVERDAERKLNSSGQVKSTEVETYEIMQLYGEQVRRLIEKNDQPLDAKDAAKEEEKLSKLANKRKNESEEEREKREEDREKQRAKNNEFYGEVPNAYEFRLEGSETLNGREVWVIAGEPRPDFHAHSKDAEMLSRIRGKLWIDKEEMQLAKMDIDVLDTLAFGWVLARIHKGTQLTYEQTRVNDEVWLPLHLQVKVDMRLALFKNDNEEDENTYRDYKKFRTSAKIVGMGEVKEQNPAGNDSRK